MNKNFFNRDRKFPSTISRPAQHKLQNKSSVNKLIKKEDSANSPSSPSANEVKKMETGDKSSIVKDELSQEVDDLLKDDKDEKSIKKENLNSLDVLKDFADGVAKELEKKKELEREKERQKEKERAKERSKEKENKKEKSSSSSHSSDKKKDKHRDKDRERDKERERQREERRRREKEERRRKEKEKERERIRREPKPFKETEMRNGLDSKQKEKIKEVVQRLKDESLSKKKDNSSSPTSEKPKVIKKDIPTVDKAPKSSLSFDALMSAMDTTKKTVKAPPIKNKNRDLLASFSTTPMPVAKKDSKPDKELPNLKDIFNMRTEDKSSKIIPAADFLKERSKSLKRPADTALEAPKLKIKSPSQLKESNGFGDFLSNIMKDDIQPKKKVIKIAELKQKTEEEERALAAKKKEEEEKAESNKSEPESISSGLSFYRDTLEEGNNDDARSNSPDDYSEEAIKKASPKPEDVPLEEQVPRVVRGQLVIARGTFRSRKKVTWPEDDANIVAVKYFELDENERVNVNKLKFEEMRKKEFELEKNALKQQTKLAGEEARPWPKLASCDFVAPEVEYGSQSLEKNAQLQREGSVLQALWFNNTPCNPSEPDNSSTVKFECKDIPLEDDDQEETFQDYSKENWPDPVKDMLAPTNTQDLIFENLQKMMGTGNLQMPNRPVVGIASEMELYKQGLLPEPPKHLMDENNLPDDAYDGGMEMYDQYEEPYQGYEDETMLPGAGMPMDYQGGNQWPPGPFPPQQSGYGGGPMPQQRSNWRGGFRGFPPRGGRGNYGDNRGGGGRGFDSRGGGRGFDTRGRGFDSRGRGGGGGYNDSRGKRGRVCRYWEAKGFCREGDNCLYQHPPKR